MGTVLLGKEPLFEEAASRICLPLHMDKQCLSRTTVEYVRNYDELSRAVNRIPEWGIGVAIPDEGKVIVIKRGSPDKINRVLLHELAHIALHRKLRGMWVPRWFDEGVAEYLAGGQTFGGQIRLAWAVLFRRVLSLDALEEVNTFGYEHAGLAYAEAVDAVKFLADRCSLGEVCDSMVKYGDFYKGFYRACGMNVNQFYRKWLEHLKRKYLLLLVVGDMRFLWSAVVLFVLTFGLWRFFRLRQRMAQLHRQAEQEHWLEPPED